MNIVSLYISFTGDSRLHVPGTNGLLCQDHFYNWLLFTRGTTYSYSNICHSLFLVRECSAPRLYRRCPKVLLPRKIFNLVASFLSLFETAPTCVALTGFSDNLNECLITSLPGAKTASIVKTYGPTEFERSLVSPTVTIIERHDFRSILDYLLMKLRTALDRDWLQSLALLHKVVYTTFIVNFYMIFVENFATLFSASFLWNTHLMKLPNS